MGAVVISFRRIRKKERILRRGKMNFPQKVFSHSSSTNFYSDALSEKLSWIFAALGQFLEGGDCFVAVLAVGYTEP